MSRLPNWYSRLMSYIDEIRRTPHSLGRHDCALFAAGAVEAMTGEDPAAPWRGQYETLEEGLLLLQSSGYIDHVAVAASIGERVHKTDAQTGDIAVVATPQGMALGVVSGSRVMVLMSGSLGTLEITERSVRPTMYRVD